VIHRAQEVLFDLECKTETLATKKVNRNVHQITPASQIPLFGQKPKVVIDLETLDINSLTPLEALNKLYELQQKAKET
jgi:DNA mismatch repair protein MutS